MAFKDFFNKNKDKDTVEKDKHKQEVDENKKLVGKIQSMYKDAYSAKSNQYERWKKCHEAYTGELFVRNLPEYRANEVSNYIFATIETIKPIMLNDNPKTQVIPKQGSLYDKARTIQNILDSEWKRTKMFRKLHIINHLNLIFGTAIVGMFWNAKAKNGLGDVEPVAISPLNFFIEPSATEVENAQYVMYATYKKVSEVISSFPDKEEELKRTGTTDVDGNLTFGNDANSQGRDNLLYIECYMRDNTKDITEEEDESGEKYKVTKMKYPKGRRIVIAGDVLISDEENPYSDGAFPFVSIRCYPQHGSFWGISEVENLISPQEHQNKIMNSIIDNANLNGNPWTIMDKNSGVERSSLTNAPGLVVRKNPGTEFRREAPPPLPSYIINLTDSLKKDMEYVSGMYDVVRGERPGSITAASAIQALNEQAQGRIRLKVQVLEDFIGELGAMWVRRVQQFWITQRTIRVTGNFVAPESTTQQIVQMKDVNGQLISFLDVTADEIDGDYDIEIFAGSTMQTNKSAIAQTVIQLAQTTAEDGLPMLDRKTVLENVIDTVGQININEIIEYFGQMQQQQAESQASANDGLMQTEQMKMEHEIQMQQSEQQHEVGMANMEHASKTQIEGAKAENQNVMQDKQLQSNKEISSAKTGQANENEIQSNQNGNMEEIMKLVEHLLSLPQEQYEQLLIENPELSNYVEELLARMEE